MSLLDDFPHSVNIVRPFNRRDKYGGTEQTEETVYEDEPAFKQPVSATDALDYEKRNMNVSHVIYFQRDLGLTTEHRVIHDGESYLVVAFSDASAGLGVVWKAAALYRTGGPT